MMGKYHHINLLRGYSGIHDSLCYLRTLTITKTKYGKSSASEQLHHRIVIMLVQVGNRIIKYVIIL